MKRQFILFFVLLYAMCNSQIFESQKANALSLINQDAENIRLDNQISQGKNFNQNDNLQPQETNSLNDLSLSGFEIMKNQGKTEDFTKRDAFSKHYPNEDGSFTAVISAGPIHFPEKRKMGEY